MYRYNDALHFKELFNDTIFSLALNRKVIPQYIIDLGTYAPQEETRYNMTSPQANPLEGKRTVRGLLETPFYLLINITKLEDNRHILYNKRSGDLENVAFTYSDSEKKKFDNKYFNPKYVSEDKKALITYEASEDVENDNNPVVVVATLKE